VSCVFCLENHELRDEQILLRGEHLYVCAPRGQLVEGYLLIAPYRCIGCIAHFPPTYFRELEEMSASIGAFYAAAYGADAVTVYEQGRAGGGASVDGLGKFPLHAHLCFLPMVTALPRVLASRYQPKRLGGPRDLGVGAAGEPYVYLESEGERCVYLGQSPKDRQDLARQRLKPLLASLIGHPERGSWREFPGDRLLSQLIERWRRTWLT
jgi:diadenosine tetraphosphate (Ap4A) HIT family hydrolase